jgi:RNA polymerase sigma-70 factor (ECF subfamily)
MYPLAHEVTFDVAAATQVDPRAFYETHADFVRRAVIRLGGPGQDVDDLMQDVFLIALRKLDEFEGRSKVTTWLYGIAARVVSSARRRSRFKQLIGFQPAHEPVESRTPADLFEDREASDVVYDSLDKLSERKRTVFVLYEIEGLSGEEIAAIVDCPLKTVWTRLHHARREFFANAARRVK